MTVHFVYVQGDGIGTPFAITNETARRLQQKHSLIVYDWAERATIYPLPGDILIGHPHPVTDTVFRRSFPMPEWGKRIVLCPFAHAQPEYIAFLDQLVPFADRYLAICGPYWLRTIRQSLFAHWEEKVTRVDLGVNQDHFPGLKSSFSPAGRRRFVTVGRLGSNKGSDYLAALAEAAPDLSFSWIGGDCFPSSQVSSLGAHDFRNRKSLELFAEHDFVIQCGRSDANPTTILEGASLGLVPVCTPQSGYEGYSWLVNIPLDNIEEALGILRMLNQCPESDLRDRQQRAQEAIRKDFTWDHFVSAVEKAIAEPSPPKITQIDALDVQRSELKRLADGFEKQCRRQARKELIQRPFAAARRVASFWR